MAQKKHDTQNLFDMLGTHATQQTQDTQQKYDTQKKQKGRPKLSPEEKKGGYRYNLNLDMELKRYIKNKAWQERKSATDYINDLIRADMEQYFANGGTTEGWIDIDE